MRGSRAGVPERLPGRAPHSAPRKALILLLAGLVLAASWPVPARAAELMLLEPQRTNYRAYGWLFLVATLGAFSAASNDFAESKKSLDQANASYKQYQVANTAASAATLHDKSQSQLNTAKAYESTANAAVFLGVVFALATIYSFRSGDQTEGPMLLSANSVGWRVNF